MISNQPVSVFRLKPFFTFLALIGCLAGAQSLQAAAIAQTDFAKAAAVGQEIKKDKLATDYCHGFDRKFNRGSESARVVRPGDAITITLQQGLIKDFPEFTFRKVKTGDIAIIVDVRERKTGDDFNFSAGSERSGRVVFFQQNVAAGAPLNLANLPIYGPVEYGGYPLMISLYAVEIDSEDKKKFTSLLDTLANFGKTLTAANPVAFSILQSLGKSLLDSNKDDLLLEYRAEFHPHSYERNGLKTMALEYGNYAFIASDSKSKEDAEEWLNWSKINYRAGNGRLYKNLNCSEPYRTESWLTLQINGGDLSRASDLPRGAAEKLLELGGTSRSSDEVKKQLESLAADLKNADVKQKNFRHDREILVAILGQQGPTEPRAATYPRIAYLNASSVKPQVERIIGATEKALQGQSNPEYEYVHAKELVGLLRDIATEENRITFSVNKFVKDEVVKAIYPSQSAPATEANRN